MLDPVPFAGAGRQMADGDGQAKFVGQRLQFAFPCVRAPLLPPQSAVINDDGLADSGRDPCCATSGGSH